MAEMVCRSCARTVPPEATTCPHCGAADPIVTAATSGPDPDQAAAPIRRDPDQATPPIRRDPDPATPATVPAPERDTAGSRMKGALKAVGCLVLALIVLGIALIAGVFDILF